jgi:hypothetical protein
MKAYTLRGTSGNSMERIPWAQSEITDNRDSIIPNPTVNPSLNKRLGLRHKYPNHSYVYRTDSNNNKKNEYYSNDVENEHQSHDYESGNLLWM